MLKKWRKAIKLEVEEKVGLEKMEEVEAAHQDDHTELDSFVNNVSFEKVELADHTEVLFRDEQPDLFADNVQDREVLFKKEIEELGIVIWFTRDLS